MGVYDNCIILIPALQPDERMIQLIYGLHNLGFNKIAITDDGSSEDRHNIFKKPNLWVLVLCIILRKWERGCVKKCITIGG